MANVPTFSYDELTAPFKALTELSLSNFEKVAKLNADLSIKYANMYAENALAALEVTDQNAAKEYAGKQTQVLKAVADSIVEDSKVYAELGKEFTEDLQKVISKETTKARKKAA